MVEPREEKCLFLSEDEITTLSTVLARVRGQGDVREDEETDIEIILEKLDIL